jgi:hypothetical protein
LTAWAGRRVATIATAATWTGSSTTRFVGTALIPSKATWTGTSSTIWQGNLAGRCGPIWIHAGQVYADGVQLGDVYADGVQVGDVFAGGVQVVETLDDQLAPV